MKRERFVLTGSTENQLQQVQRFLRQLSRRQVKVASVVTPPVPISGYVEFPDKDYVVFRTLIIAPGKIGRACVFIGRVDKDSKPEIEVEIRGLTGTTTYNFSPTKGLAAHEGDHPVAAGDRIIVRVRYVQSMNRPETPSIGEIWTGLVFYGESDSGDAQRVLVDDILKGESDEGI